MVSEEVHGALEEGVVEAVGDDFVATFFDDMPFDAGAEPGKWGEVDGFSCAIFHGKWDLLKVVRVADSRDDAASGGGGEAFVGHLNGAGRGFRFFGGSELAGFRVERGVELGFDFGCGWDEFFPGEVFGDFLGAVSVFVEPPDGE